MGRHPRAAPARPCSPEDLTALSTLLAEVPWLPFGALVTVVVVAPILGVLVVRLPRTTLVLAVLAVVAVLGLTLYPEGTPSGAVGCSVGLPFLSPTAVESVANVLLFVPVTFLAGLRSAAVETVQAFVLDIGRACDTGDWVTNSIGAVLGGLAALAALALARRRSVGRR